VGAGFADETRYSAQLELYGRAITVGAVDDSEAGLDTCVAAGILRGADRALLRPERRQLPGSTGGASISVTGISRTVRSGASPINCST
jgi:hypothetical protein